jgi:capsular polysaccharide transport system permease protein
LSKIEVQRLGPRLSYAGAPATSEPASKWLGLWIAARDRMGDIRLRFLVLVVVPTSLASIYFGAIASDLYVSRTQYLVRGVDSHRSAGLGALLNTFGLSRAADDTSAIESFMQSREAIQKLGETVDLREIYGRREADFWARYPHAWQKHTFERLYTKTRDYISVIQDQSTGITALEVAAFRPDDAHKVAETLLHLAEDMVNRMNARALSDSITQAKSEVAQARDEVVQTQADLTAFRNKELLVDPVSFAGVLLEAIGQLSLERARTQTEMDETTHISPSSPALGSMKARAEALEKKIGEEREKLAGSDSAIAEKVSTYERLTLLRDLADKRYSSALLSLQSAQDEAQRQQVYIEVIEPPNLPDEAIRPERLRLILTVFVISMAAFSILWILTVGSKDHAQ